MNNLQQHITPIMTSNYSYGLLICYLDYITDIQLRLIKHSKGLYKKLLLCIDNKYNKYINKEIMVSKIPKRYLEDIEVILVDIDTNKIKSYLKKYQEGSIVHLELAIDKNIDLDLPCYFYIEGDEYDKDLLEKINDIDKKLVKI